MNETVIKGSRTKVALLLACCVLFAAGGAWMLTDPTVDRTMALLCVGLFGLGIPLSLYLLVRPQTLTLRSDVFTVQTLWKSFDVAWADVERFHAWHNPAAHQTLVAWTYRPGRAPTGALAQISAGLGAEGAMPGMMSMSTDKLVTLMNQRLEASRS